MASNAVLNLLKPEELLMLAEGLNIFRVVTPTSYADKSLAESQIRSRTGCNVVAICDRDTACINPEPDYRLNENDELIEPPITYRDKRFDGIMDEVFAIIPKDQIYKIAGIQFLQFNSIFQLFALKKYDPDTLLASDSFLMIPDLINFFLTGKKFNEYTNASTTSLMNAKSREMSKKLFNELDIPIKINEQIISPSQKIGKLSTALQDELNINETDVIAVGSHDTASAIAAVPAEGNNWAYLSSGTWSLLGIELREPILSESALKYSFTNEGGVESTICFLKNIIGLWILQRSQGWNQQQILHLKIR